VVLGREQTFQVDEIARGRSNEMLNLSPKPAPRFGHRMKSLEITWTLMKRFRTPQHHHKVSKRRPTVASW